MATTPACFRGGRRRFRIYLPFRNVTVSFTLRPHRAVTVRYGAVRCCENATTCEATRAVPLTCYTRRSGRSHVVVFFVLVFFLTFGAEAFLPAGFWVRRGDSDREQQHRLNTKHERRWQPRTRRALSTEQMWVSVG